MEKINELREILNGFVKCHKCHVECLAKILMGMYIAKTVNLAEIAGVMYGKVKQSSRYRRLQRFFQLARLDYDLIAKFIVNWLCPKAPWYLAIDRTNWQWGKKDINILVLAVVYKSAAIPVYWMVLNKQGSTDVRERKALIQRFADVFGKKSIVGVLADREFIGKEWFRYLVWKKIPFFIRIKGNALVTNNRGKKVRAESLFRQLKSGEKHQIKEERDVYGRSLYLTGARSPLTGGLMIIASNQRVDDAVEIYLKRWQIETLFGCLKGRGFRFEDTHITDRVKIKKMMALLAIAFCWAHKTGEWRNAEQKAIPLKAHHRLAVSIFRYGLDFLREAILRIVQKSSLFKVCLRLFLRSPNLEKPLPIMAFGVIL